MKRIVSFAAVCALGAAAFMPLPSIAQSGTYVFVPDAPPAARYESIPAARSGQIWSPGFWNWDGSRHVWVAGHWEAARSGYQYQRSEWARENDGWRLNRGGWQQASAQLAAQSATNAAIQAQERTAYETGMISVKPPRARFERMPRARAGYMWAPGYWDWRGNRHEWVSGTWLRTRPGHMYFNPRWIERNGQWFLEEGRWERAGGGRDRDRNGVQDRFEHGGDRNRNAIPDHLERRNGDRDGDGYHNDDDRFPDNPRRQ